MSYKTRPGLLYHNSHAHKDGKVDIPGKGAVEDSSTGILVPNREMSPASSSPQNVAVATAASAQPQYPAPPHYKPMVAGNPSPYGAQPPSSNHRYPHFPPHNLPPPPYYNPTTQSTSNSVPTASFIAPNKNASQESSNASVDMPGWIMFFLQIFCGYDASFLQYLNALLVYFE